jgi:hypothetical protein
MELIFERGSKEQASGHALLYFRNSANQAEVWATYLVVPPIPIQMTKYMPAMFASKLPIGDMTSVSAIPLPPIPEQVESAGYLQRLAEMRGDDLIFGGSVETAEMQGMLFIVTEAAQTYFSLYSARPVPPEEVQSQSETQHLLYALLGEPEKLRELARAAGDLRYGVDGNDQRQIAEASAEIEALAGHLPEKYRVKDFLAAAQIPGQRGAKLAELFLERCYKIAAEDYRAVVSIEAEIRELSAAE